LPEAPDKPKAAEKEEINSFKTSTA